MADNLTYSDYTDRQLMLMRGETDAYEVQAKALLEFFRTVHLPDVPTVDEIEDLSRQIDEALIRIDHDITRMENPQ